MPVIHNPTEQDMQDWNRQHGFPIEEYHYGTSVRTRDSAQNELHKFKDNPPAVDIPVTIHVTVPADNTFVTEQKAHTPLLSCLNKINKPSIACRSGTGSFIKHISIARRVFSKDEVHVKHILLPKKYRN